MGVEVGICLANSSQQIDVDSFVYVWNGEVSLRPVPPLQHWVSWVLVSEGAGFLSPVAVAQR